MPATRFAWLLHTDTTVAPVETTAIVLARLDPEVRRCRRPAPRGPVAADPAALTAVSTASPGHGTTVVELLRADGPTTTIAHRGFSARAPENTLSAFRAAIQAGADMLELDVIDSADGEPVVIHDDTVDRTTDGRGRVRGTTLAELRSLDAGSWFSREFAGERIPTLGQVLDLAAGRASVNIEIKSQTSTEVVARIVHEVRSRNLGPYVLLSSFADEHVRHSLELAPDIPRAALFDRMPDDPCRQAEELGAVAVNVHSRLASPELLVECHRRGLALTVFTVNGRSRLEALVGMGVDGVFTDQPDRLLDIAHEHDWAEAPSAA